MLSTGCGEKNDAKLSAVCIREKLKAEGEEQGEDAFDKRLTIAQELNVGCCVLQIDSDGTVFADLAGGGSHGSSSDQMVGAPDDPT